MHVLLIFLVLFLPYGLVGQSDSLLRATPWQEEGTGYVLRFTPDGTFEQDYGEDARNGRYLMGRYALDSTQRIVTLSVDYFLGKTRVPVRYRRGQDFYLDYRIEALDSTTLILTDLLTDKIRTFVAIPEDREDPALRRIPKPPVGKLKLPEGWGM
ncbi:hypothetical protein [Lewinella sp. JB7]|uniref:hypothetical protein n=1 Tax=Lewinella sp. JB7 TaxID=2962887 RepID=UPI0020C95CA3|nr:hypothetical protein [Lewinella sp. JB7]MCP9234847.1 hypothetical protein [Lewinella sp. JB7]